MKKRIFALACTLILVFGMSVTVFAANSPSAGDVSSQYTQETLDSYAKAASVTSEVGATVGSTTPAIAASAVSQAKSTVSASASVVSVVDLIVPAGTGEATFTLTGVSVKAGQKVTILHYIESTGTWETISDVTVADGSVTFTMGKNGYSPVAIVVEAETAAAAPAAPAASATPAATNTAATAPKTGDMSMMVSVMAVICLAGVVIFGKKAKLN